MLTLDQEAQVRAYFQDTAAFFAQLDTWLAAFERAGERLLREQHDTVAAGPQTLANYAGGSDG